jgi:acyl-CoA thioesterase I
MGIRRTRHAARLAFLLLSACDPPAAETDGGPAQDAGSRLDARAIDAYVVREDARTPIDASPCIPSADVVRLACVGDSITFGYDLDPSEAYPSVLGELLGDRFVVGNFGQNGVTALENGDNPIRNAIVFTQSNEFDPDLVVIQLGTNDSKPDNWGPHEGEFEGDYEDLVEHYRSLGATVMISIPPPAYMATSYWQIELVVPHIRAVAERLGAPVIDVHEALSGHPELFPADGVHPNADGARAIAETVADGVRAQLCP